MRKLFFILTAILSFVTAKAESTETVEVDGIIYELHQSESTYYSNWFSSRVENWCAIVGYQNIESESVTIPSTITNNGEEYTVRQINYGAFTYCTSIKNINLPNTLIAIGSQAFAGSGITSIDLQNTMVDHIYPGCFLSCKQLTKVNLGQRIFEIEYDVFQECNNIKTLQLASRGTSSLPPNLESLYLADSCYIPKGDYSNTTLYSSSKALPSYIEEHADSFKAYKVWDFEVADSICCDYDGEWREIITPDMPPVQPSMHFNCIVAYANHPIRIPFSVKPVNTQFKAIKVDFSGQYASFDEHYEYDGEDAIIVTFGNSPYGDPDRYQENFIFHMDVMPIFKGTGWHQDTNRIYFIVLPDPDYPTSLQFKNSEVRIKPFEFYYQPVEILPEGSTSPKLTWSSSNPSMASVTQEGKVYPFVEEGTVTISVTDGKDLSASYTAIIDVNATGIEEVIVDGDDMPVEYYNLNGIRVAADVLTPGLYVRRQGSKSEKFIVK